MGSQGPSTQLQEEAEGFDSLLRYVTNRLLGHPANYTFQPYQTKMFLLIRKEKKKVSLKNSLFKS